MRDIYQELYTTTDYGNGALNKSPGVRYYPLFKDFLVGPVADLGCGTGDLVKLLRSEGFDAQGCDWVELNNDMLVADIREQLDLTRFESIVCMDVLEHLELADLPRVMDNLRQAQRVVVSVHNGPSVSHPKGVELHTCRLPLSEWEKLFSAYFTVHKTIVLDPGVRCLYLLVNNAVL